jgi:hypothetical protein
LSENSPEKDEKDEKKKKPMTGGKRASRLTARIVKIVDGLRDPGQARDAGLDQHAWKDAEDVTAYLRHTFRDFERSQHKVLRKVVRDGAFRSLARSLGALVRRRPGSARAKDDCRRWAAILKQRPAPCERASL